MLRYGTRVKEICGGEASQTTNNRMELMAAIQALEHLTRPVPVRPHTGSSYLRDGITRWLHGWRRNGWQTAERKPVKNVDLWQRLDTAAQRHQVEWIWVKGHAGDPGNEGADELANRGMLDAAGQNGARPVHRPAAVQAVPDPQARCEHDRIRSQCWECRPNVPIFPTGSLHLRRYRLPRRRGLRGPARWLATDLPTRWHPQ